MTDLSDPKEWESRASDLEYRASKIEKILLSTEKEAELYRKLIEAHKRRVAAEEEVAPEEEAKP